jgi:2-octaprenyl-6-methoxyphenol hydroxylase
LGEVKLIDKPFKYNLDLIVADQFYFERMALVGDAAHGIHPIAGQGFNVGIDDIKVLADLVKEYFECGLDIGCETLLKKYNHSRKIGAYKMIAATDGLNGLFSNNSTILKGLRNAGLGIVEKIPTLKKFFIKNAGGS